MLAIIHAPTGEILGFAETSPSQEGLQTVAFPDRVIIGVDETVVQGNYNTDLFWFDAGDFLPRPALFAPSYQLAADGVAAVTVTLPVGTAITFNGSTTVATVEDDEFEFSSAFAGRFVFTVAPPFPYRPQTVEIVAS